MASTSNDRTVGWLGGTVHLAFFIRYAMLVPAALLLLALLGWKFRTNTILGNVFLVDSPAQLLQLTWLSLIAVALSLVQARVTLLNARQRFPDCPPWRIGAAEFSKIGSLLWIGIWLICGLCLPLVCSWATPYGDQGVPPTLSYILRQYGASLALGVLIAAGLLFASSGAARFAIGQNLTAAELLPTDACFRRLSGLRFVAVADALLARLLSRFPGYSEPAETASPEESPWYRLRPGHAQLTLTLLLALAGYVFAYWAVTPGDSSIPVLFYVVLILIITGTLLSATSFFLDLYRLPVPVVLVVFGIFISLLSQNDHFFVMKPLAEMADPPRLYDVVRQWAPDEADSPAQPVLPRGKDGKRTLVVVAAAGGGIQAAAWTAKVMTALHARYGLPFTRSVRLMSGVSGGSVGTMYYLDRYDALCNAATPAQAKATLASINEQAQASSLEATAWGVAFYDLAPALLPLRRYWPGLLRDRGTVLEDLWTSRLAHKDPQTYTVRRMLDDILNKGYPIPIFNSTNGSTGARFLWSPIKLIERDMGRICDPEELVKAYPDWDLSVVSAARLSATFSYVSPICRPAFGDAPYPRVPFADGGYAENEGILTAIQALTQLLSHYQADDDDDEVPPFERILIVRIQPFAGAQPMPRTTYDQPDESLEGHVSASAWRRALTGPLELLTQVRQSSQTERGEWEAAQMQAPILAEVRRWASGADDGTTVAAVARAAPRSPAGMRRWLEPFAVTHNLVRRQKTGEVTRLSQTGNENAETPPREPPHPLRDRDQAATAETPPLQIAAIKFAFTLPGHAGVSHAAKLVVEQTSDEWDDYFTPLSWKMNQRQKDAIDAAWDRIATSDLGNLSPLNEPLFFAPGDEEPSLTLDDIFSHLDE